MHCHCFVIEGASVEGPREKQRQGLLSLSLEDSSRDKESPARRAVDV